MLLPSRVRFLHVIQPPHFVWEVEGAMVTFSIRFPLKLEICSRALVSLKNFWNFRLPIILTPLACNISLTSTKMYNRISSQNVVHLLSFAPCVGEQTHPRVKHVNSSYFTFCVFQSVHYCISL